jgi:nitrite reductase/ring-hydroxylating ferredoxin subunit
MAEVLIRLCGSAELGEGEMLRVEREGGEPIAVYRISGAFYATGDTCTHGKASLADGDLTGFTVSCPFHSGMFDVRTGAAIASPACIPIKVYRTRVENGDVFAVLGAAEPEATRAGDAL